MGSKVTLLYTVHSFYSCKVVGEILRTQISELKERRSGRYHVRHQVAIDRIREETSRT